MEKEVQFEKETGFIEAQWLRYTVLSNHESVFLCFCHGRPTRKFISEGEGGRGVGGKKLCGCERERVIKCQKQRSVVLSEEAACCDFLQFFGQLSHTPPHSQCVL